MCGIAGFTVRGDRESSLDLAAMISAMHHRGPDDRGSFSPPPSPDAARAAIGMARLSIVGIGNGHQPIVSEDGRHAIVGNGEIYDAPAHRRALEGKGHRFATDSDIESLLHLYEEHGTDGFARVNGMFAVAILEVASGRVLVARDRIGIKPLFLATHEGDHAFASEIPALLAGLPSSFDRSIDPVALGDFLAHGYVPAPRTIHRAITRLPAGHWAWLDPGRTITPTAWWQLPDYAPQDRPLDAWADEVAALIEDSVRLRTLGDVPAGAFLSGGLDSSALLAVLSKQVEAPVDAFTLGFDSAAHDERAAARETAEHCGAHHHTALFEEPSAEEVEAIFRHLGEPFADVSILPTDRVSALAAEHVKFVLSGDGGDELFGGYAWFTAEARRRSLPGPLRGTARLLRPVLSGGQEAMGSGWLGKGLRYLGDLSSHSGTSFLRRRRLAAPALTSALIDRELGGSIPTATTLAAHAAQWSGTEPELWLDLDRRFYLGGDILEKVDRATMRHSLEARVPLLDHRIIELAARIPVDMHLGPERTGKQVLRRAIARLLPASLFERPKRGFGIPIDAWLRGPLGTAARARLLESSALDGLLDRRAVTETLDRHARGVANHGHLIFGLWSLAVWSDCLPVAATNASGRELITH